MPRIIQAYQLRPGDKFEEIPRAWHGPGVVIEVYTRFKDGAPYIVTPDKKPLPSWCSTPSKWNPTLTLKFNNDKVINPPGVLYCAPEQKVRLLRRNGKLVKGRPSPLPKADRQVEVRSWQDNGAT